MRINLNVTERYAPSFNDNCNWPVAREIISNALDDDPTQVMIIQSGSLLDVRTSTAPTLEQLLVLGEGTKQPGSDTIGQFGEGLKMAANATCRGKGKMVVELPNHTVRYSYQVPKGFSTATLHADVREASNPPGCRIRIELDRVGTHADRVLKNREVEILDRTGGEEVTRIYHKGIWVCDLPGSSRHHYNLHRAEINRDRTIVDTVTLHHEVGSLLLRNLTVEMCEDIIQNPDSCALEITALKQVSSWNVDARHRDLFAQAFRNLHGAQAVVASSEHKHNDTAAFLGFKVAKIPDGIESVLIGYGSDVKSSRDVVPDPNHLEIVEIDVGWKQDIDRLSRLAEMLEIPGFRMRVFKPDGIHLGFYRRDGDGNVEISISAHLFVDGLQSQLYGTFLHECAHHKDFCEDASRNMEHALTKLAGKLADMLLKEVEA